MTHDELRHLIAQLPGDRRVTVIVIEHTGAASSAVEGATTSSATVAASGQHANMHAPAPAATPLDLARGALRDAPTLRLTPVEWSKAFGGEITVREVRRALEAAALEFEARGEGRGHGALVVRPAAMVSYLTARQEAMASRGKRPAWFSRVVKGATNAS